MQGLHYDQGDGLMLCEQQLSQGDDCTCCHVMFRSVVVEIDFTVTNRERTNTQGFNWSFKADTFSVVDNSCVFELLILQRFSNSSVDNMNSSMSSPEQGIYGLGFNAINGSGNL